MHIQVPGTHGFIRHQKHHSSGETCVRHEHNLQTLHHITAHLFIIVRPHISKHLLRCVSYQNEALNHLEDNLLHLIRSELMIPIKHGDTEHVTFVYIEHRTPNL